MSESSDDTLLGGMLQRLSARFREIIIPKNGNQWPALLILGECDRTDYDAIADELEQKLATVIDKFHRGRNLADEATSGQVRFVGYRIEAEQMFDNVQRAIQNCLVEARHSPPPADVEIELAAIETQYQALRDLTRTSIQAVLNQLAGKEFPTLVAKQEIATRLREVMKRMDLRVKCPGCGEPAILKASSAGKAEIGIFTFDHPVAGARSTHRGPTQFPENLEVVDAPVDRRARTTNPS